MVNKLTAHSNEQFAGLTPATFGIAFSEISSAPINAHGTPAADNVYTPI